MSGLCRPGDSGQPSTKGTDSCKPPFKGALGSLGGEGRGSEELRGVSHAVQTAAAELSGALRSPTKREHLNLVSEWNLQLV